MPEDTFDGPDGLWACEERSYHQLTAESVGATFYEQGQQAPRTVEVLPQGMAIRLPARSRIISSYHLLNAETTDVPGHTTLTLYTIPRAEVRSQLTILRLTEMGVDRDIATHSGPCDVSFLDRPAM